MQPHKYLTRHAEPEARSLAAAQWIEAVFDFVLVLPCYDEERNDIERVLGFCAGHNALLILVVNQPETVEHCDNNDVILGWLKTTASKSISQEMCFRNVGGAHVLLIDRTQSRIPVAQGVGLARKIGADCAHSLITRGAIKSPWIFSTDADAYLPQDYFRAADGHAGCSAVIYPFEHIASGNADIDIATALYELRLHNYIAGLRQAGSPYAFHTLGSTLAVDATHYAAAHGFPKRAGGEDFYLLNKLAKLAPVKSLQQPLLQLQARASHRVPFGTGPAVTKLAASEDMLLQPLFYHANCFGILKDWLDFFAQCANRIYGNQPVDQWRSWLLSRDNNSSELLLQIIDAEEFETILHKARRQCSDAAALQRYLHTWFDGFRTLKLVHAARDKHFSMQNFRQCFGDVDINGDSVLAYIVALNQQFRAKQLK
jgi:hypothetical protein